MADGAAPVIIPASNGIARIAHLDSFLRGEGDVVVGWGRKPSGDKARRLAERRGLRWLLLEDGFLRSVDRHAPPISLIVDDVGIYYDAGAPSRLEQLVPCPLAEPEAARARALAAAWRDGGVSKYNHAPDYRAPLPPRYVLVVDQTWGDASIACGQAGPESFDAMLRAALDENPDCDVLLKVHPDIFSHGKKGYFDLRDLLANPRVHLIAEACHAVRLIREAEAVYVVTSQMGFEALVWGKRVRCFGMPFFAGWGLTQDQLAPPGRRRPASLEQLVHAALITYPRYVDPATGAPWQPEQAIAHVAAGRRALRETSGHAKGWTSRLNALLRRRGSRS